MVIIQIGCNDCQDQVRDFIFANEDKIEKLIVIDALQQSIEAAKIIYAPLKNKFFPVLSAVGLYNGVIPFFYPEDQDCSIHASTSLEHVAAHNHSKIKIFCSPLLRLDNVLHSFDIKKVDRLYIDVEGLDVDILLDLSFTDFDIDFIEYEFCHSDGTFESGQKNQQLKEKLQSLGYELHQSDQYNLTAQKL